MRNQLILASILMIVIWGIGNLIGYQFLGAEIVGMYGNLDLQTAQNILVWMGIWLLSGGVTGLILRWISPVVKWWHIILLAAGWVLAGLMQWLVRWPLLGVFTVLTLRRVDFTLSWKEAGTILSGWTLLGIGLQAFAHLIFQNAAPLFLVAARGVLPGAAAGVFMIWRLFAAQWGQTAGKSPLASLKERFDRLEKNAIMKRLLKTDIEKELYALVVISFGLGLVTLITSMGIWSRVQITTPTSGTVIPFLIYLITLAPTVRVPMIITAAAALLTAVDVQKQQFYLLKLTHLTDDEVIWAYTMAPMNMTRGILTFEYIVMMLMLTTAICAFLPSFQSAGNDTSLLLFVSTLMIGVGLLGVNLLASVIGVIMALVWRDPVMAVVTAPVLMVILLLTTLFLILDNLQMLSTQFSIEIMARFMLFMVAPYIIALELMDNVNPWINQQALSQTTE